MNEGASGGEGAYTRPSLVFRPQEVAGVKYYSIGLGLKEEHAHRPRCQQGGTVREQRRLNYNITMKRRSYSDKELSSLLSSSLSSLFSLPIPPSNY